MATIIENDYGRRIIKLSVDDIIATVREYQKIIGNPNSYEEIRSKLKKEEFYLPEDEFRN